MILGFSSLFWIEGTCGELYCSGGQITFRILKKKDQNEPGEFSLKVARQALRLTVFSELDVFNIFEFYSGSWPCYLTDFLSPRLVGAVEAKICEDLIITTGARCSLALLATELFHYSPTPARVPAGYLHTPDTELSFYLVIFFICATSLFIVLLFSLDQKNWEDKKMIMGEYKIVSGRLSSSPMWTASPNHSLFH